MSHVLHVQGGRESTNCTRAKSSDTCREFVIKNDFDMKFYETR